MLASMKEILPHVLNRPEPGDTSQSCLAFMDTYRYRVAELLDPLFQLLSL